MGANTHRHVLQGLCHAQVRMSKYTVSHTISSAEAFVQRLSLTLRDRKINTITQERDANPKECLAQSSFDMKMSTFRR